VLRKSGFRPASLLAQRLALTAVAAFPLAAAAQDEEGETASRTTDDASATSADAEAAPLAADAPATSVVFGYDVGLFAGTYLQAPEFGPLADLGATAEVRHAEHRLRLGLDYTFDPFSSKSFNFGEDSTNDADGRLVQRVQEVEGELRWRANWSPLVESTVTAATGQRYAEYRSDHRWHIDAAAGLRVGAARSGHGIYVAPTVDFFRRIYPNYRVSGRSIDQQGGGGELELGHEFGADGEVSVSYGASVTNYLDARYDQQDASGAVVRATESKSYFRHVLAVGAGARLTDVASVRLSYGFLRNNAWNYFRQMAGRTETGELEVRLFRDYYDYARHTVRVAGEWELPGGFDAEVFGEIELRAFDTYEARDADNVWTGELRDDQRIEVGFEMGYPVWERGDHTLRATAFGSHISERSNMKRDVSFVANYDITRAFLGLELSN
jgi:hypothetical protein